MSFSTSYPKIMKAPISFGAIVIALFAATVSILAQPAVDISALDTTAFPAIEMRVRFMQGNAVVGDILKEQVGVTENGVPVDFTLDCPNTVPVAVSLVLDKSLSMAFVPGAPDWTWDPDSLKWRGAKDAIKAFAGQLQTPNVAELITFGHFMDLVIGFTSDGRELSSRLDSVTLTSGTSAWAACKMAMDNLSQRSEKRVVILLTDGQDNGSMIFHGVSYNDLFGLADMYDVTIYTVGLSEAGTAADLRQLSDYTGGKYFFSADGNDLEDVYAEIAHDLSTPCIVRYIAPDTCGNGAYRKIDLSAMLGAGLARADSFYTAPYRKDTITVESEMPAVITANQRILRVPIVLRHTFRDTKQFLLNGDLHYPRTILRYERAEPTSSLSRFDVTVDTVAETITFEVFASVLPPNNDTLCYLIFSVQYSPNVQFGRIEWTNLESSRECQNVSQNIVASFLVDGLCDKIVRKLTPNIMQGTYPNPASGPVTIPLVIDERRASTHLTVSVKDQTGRVIEVLSKGMFSQGTHRLTWNPGNLPNGSYWIELTGLGVAESVPITLVK